MERAIDDGCKNAGYSYQKLSDSAFFWHTILLHGSCIALAIAVKKIDMIFDLAGAICCAFSIFIFPAVGYLIALYRYGGARQRANSEEAASVSNRHKCETWLYLASSWVFLALGALLIIAACYVNILRAAGKLPQESAAAAAAADV